MHLSHASNGQLLGRMDGDRNTAVFQAIEFQGLSEGVYRLVWSCDDAEVEPTSIQFSVHMTHDSFSQAQTMRRQSVQLRAQLEPYERKLRELSSRASRIQEGIRNKLRQMHSSSWQGVEQTQRPTQATAEQLYRALAQQIDDMERSPMRPARRPVGLRQKCLVDLCYADRQDDAVLVSWALQPYLAAVVVDDMSALPSSLGVGSYIIRDQVPTWTSEQR